MRDDYASRTAVRAVEVVKPRLVVNGHVHSGCYKTRIFPWESEVYLHIKRSEENQKEKCYLLYRISYDNYVDVEIRKNLIIVTEKTIYPI